MDITGFDWDDGNWPKCGKHGLSREHIQRLFSDDLAWIAPDTKHTSIV